VVKLPAAVAGLRSRLAASFPAKIGRYFLVTLRQANEDSVWLTASALAFVTILSLIPLLTAFSLIDEIRANQNWLGLRSKARSQDTIKVSDREHHVMIDRIEAGDPDGAEAAMRAHIEKSYKRLEPFASA